MIKMLKQDFVPVAIDQWYQRRQKDAEGDFYRKVAGQGPRDDFEQTTQGRYVCTPDGKLLGFNNNRGPERIRKIMLDVLETFDPSSVQATSPSKPSRREYDLSPPKDGLILRVHSKILAGFEPTEEWQTVFQSSVGRDNCWLTSAEKEELARSISNGGNVPDKLARRIVRFHLLDNTRGEPPRWKMDEIKRMELTIENGIIRGHVDLETENGERGFQAELLGKASVTDGQIDQFDLLAKGEFWGSGPYTHFAPKGRFPLAVAFRIGDGSDPADNILPHGAKGWREGYFQ
jgi:hypothetical protein